MIYVLVLAATDYDENEENVFASTSKKVVEDKLLFLKERNIFLEKMSSLYDELGDKVRQDHPLPEFPNLKSLPPKPLVWVDGLGHHNQYVIDYDKECKKINEAYHKDLEKMDVWFAEQHSLSENEMLALQYHTSFKDLEYVIDEVESD